MKILNPKIAKRIPIRDTEIYYEIYGEGPPLIMLHGYTQSSIAWQEFVREYASQFSVILIDLHGHGRSASFTKPLNVREVAEEVGLLLDELDLQRVAGIGLSFGGDVLLSLGSTRPDLLKSMVVIGANANWRAKDYPEVLATFQYKNIASFEWIRTFHAGGEEQVKAVIENLANYEICLTTKDVNAITASVLLVLGDRAEQIPISSVVELHKNLPDSQLWIVPGAGHYAHDGAYKEHFVKLSLEFLNSAGD